MKKKPNNYAIRRWRLDVIQLCWPCLFVLLLVVQGRSFGQASISGYVWMDENKNGIQDESERGFSGVRVQLFVRISGESFRQLTFLRTQSDGSFLFIIANAFLPAECYLQFEKVPGMYFSPPDQGTNNRSDSDADTSSGRTPLFTLANLANEDGWGAGYMTSPNVIPERKLEANLFLHVISSTDSAKLGEFVDFAITVTNRGPDSSVSPVLTMAISSNLEFTASTPPLDSLTMNPLRWLLPTLPAGAESMVDLRLKVIRGSDASGTIHIEPVTSDPDTSDNMSRYHLNQGVPVELIDFGAQAASEGVLVRWITASETENLGFHLYRANTKVGLYEKITPFLIDGAGTTSSLHQYEYLDKMVAPGETYYYKLQDVDFSGLTAWHGPIPVATAVPLHFGLEQNYPNPFNNQTRIRFTMGQTGHAELTIYNQLGQQVTRLFAQEWSAGQHEVIWDGTDENNLPLGSGSYICFFRSGNYHEKRVMNLVK